MPRVAPVTGKSDVPAEHHAVVDAVVAVFGNVRGPFSVLLHSPKLAERVLPLVTFFRDQSIVEARLRSVAILTYTRQLMRTNRVEPAAFDALQKRHGTQWLVELTAAANYFALLAGMVNAFEVAPPPDGDRLPA
jgi:4-carboxymuconolactone decarboxylase